MPYRIPGETPAITAKMERCVAECVAKPLKKKFKGRTKKESCIAICKASLMGTTAPRGRAGRVRRKLRGLKA